MDSSQADSSPDRRGDPALDPASPRVPPVLVEAPLPPPERTRPRSRHAPAFQVRMWSAFILVICGAMLGVGLAMTPSPSGVGTHADSLGMPPCGFYTNSGIPCPTCGCTTAVTHLAHGNVLASFRTQPFGAVVGVIAVYLLACAVFGLISGRWKGPQPFTIGWYWRSLVLAGTALLVGGWVYKIFALKYGW